MKFLKMLFGKKIGKHSSKREVIPDVNEETRTMDLGDDPLDPHGDGTIRQGDPMYDLMMNSTGGVVVGNKNNDGTWDIKTH